MSPPVAAGEAVVVYLYHSGWLVRTHSHLLIFDPVAAPGAAVLDPLGVSPADLAGQHVTVLVSHAHSDHWDPSVLRWTSDIPAITFVLGWELDAGRSCVTLGGARVVTTIEDVTIYNVHHAFDGIPESAFLVHADGLWIYHAGDHSHSQGRQDRTFRSNLEYLASRTGRVDLFFTPTWGGETFAIESLRPVAVFPMHSGGREHELARWARRPEVARLGVVFGVAERSGQCFLYQEGRLHPCPQ